MSSVALAPSNDTAIARTSQDLPGVPVSALPACRVGEVAATSGQRHHIDATAPLSVAVEAFSQSPDAIGLIVVDGDRFVGGISKQSLALCLSKPYTQFIFLRRPVTHMLAWLETAPFQCAAADDISEVITRALARAVDQRYEPVIVTDAEGGACMVDVHNLLLEQNRALSAALLSLEEQRAATARAEREKEDLHAQLVEASRHAGRAEVATGILHNVGNVLNSVSVSRSVISRKLEQSKVTQFCRAAEMLDAHAGDMAAFLAEDPRGLELPRYLTKLAAVMLVERDGLMKEVGELGDNLEHIKQVVASQQSYARARAVLQLVRPADLMDDAVRMNVMSFERHNVQLVRRYDDVGVAAVDQHRVLQILINLISNAKNAVKLVSAGDRRIVLIVSRASQDGKDLIRFVVEDTGVGIPAENLTRVFAHGFTTRQNGHGFGLHSSANVARELGGRLYAESRGLGCGARFTLELPVPAERDPNAPR